MNIGHFYFLSERYFSDFPDESLMKNKEVVDGRIHDRPCFYAFYDSASSLFWMIPISSRVEKYKKIYNQKIQRYGKCDSIVFGEVLGHEKAFLLQNMCPVTEEYIADEYIDAKSNTPVQVERELAAILSKKARRILALHRKGIRIVFPEISAIEQKLSDLHAEK